MLLGEEAGRGCRCAPKGESASVNINTVVLSKAIPPGHEGKVKLRYERAESTQQHFDNRE